MDVNARRPSESVPRHASRPAVRRFHAIFGGVPSFIVHPSDTAPALMALRARVKILGPAGPQEADLEKFFILPETDVKRENILGPGEIVAEFQLPPPAANTRSVYLKVSERQLWDHAIVSVAAVVTHRGDRCDAARIVLGGVAPLPWRVLQAEDLLRGKRIDEKLAAQAGEAAVVGAQPLKQNAYKIDLARNLVKRAVLQLASHREASGPF